MPTLAARLIRWLGVATSLSLLLLVTALISMSLGVATAVRGIEGGALIASASTAVFVGWILARSQLPGWLACLVTAILGVEFVMVHVGRLDLPIADALREFWNLVASLPSWLLPGGAPDGAAWRPLIDSLVRMLGDGLDLVQQLVGWLGALVGGKSSANPLGSEMVWSLLGWNCGGWASLAVRRLRKPLWGLAPAGALLASTLSYSGG